MKTTPSVGVIVIQNNSVLLVIEEEKSGHITGMYNTPAGRIEKDETPIQAAIRELQEETGLETTEKDMYELPKKYTADIKRKNGETIRFYHTVFFCKNFTGSLKTGNEVTPEWVAFDTIKTLRLLPNIEDMIQQAQKYLENYE